MRQAIRLASLQALLCCMSCLLSCSSDDTPHYAPVVDINPYEKIPTSGLHAVKNGETLYEIAWRYGEDYRTIAKRNSIHSPYSITAGQKIYMRGEVKPQRKHIQQPSSILSIKKRHKPIVASTRRRVSPIKEPNFRVANWQWPAQGRIAAPFSNTNKGLNIVGKFKSPIVAAAPGKVVYSGSGLRGYGNLIIIKHNGSYLSAYAHNWVNYVKESDWVKQGDVIAEMGESLHKPILHFEIRQAGKPINPAQLLSS